MTVNISILTVLVHDSLSSIYVQVNSCYHKATTAGNLGTGSSWKVTSNLNADISWKAGRIQLRTVLDCNTIRANGCAEYSKVVAPLTSGQK